MKKVTDKNSLMDFYESIVNKQYPVPVMSMQQTQWNSFLETIRTLLLMKVFFTLNSDFSEEESECLETLYESMGMSAVLSLGKIAVSQLSGEELNEESIFAKALDRAPRTYKTEFQINGECWSEMGIRLIINSVLMVDAAKILRGKTDFNNAVYSCARKIAVWLFLGGEEAEKILEDD